MTRKRTAPKLRHCVFDPDPDVPPDWCGRRTCRNCNRVGASGDAGHRPERTPNPKPRSLPPALAAAARARDAAVLGERDEYGEDNDG